MIDPELQKILRSLPTPPADPVAEERALHRALLALQNREVRPAEPARRRLWPWLVPLAGAAACVLAVLLTRPERPHAAGADAQLVLLQQMEKEFPEQLGAIVEGSQGVDLVTTERRVPASHQPLSVTFRKAGRTWRVTSYSGRHVCVSLADRPVCFELLMTDDGKVILVGDHFVWSDENRGSVDGYTVQAVPLSRS
jgi:hypothetical protein